MKKNEFDERIQNEIKYACEDISAAPLLKQKIDHAIYEQSRKERIMKKNMSMKKIVAIAAVACIFVTGSAFAAGKVKYLTSHTNLLGVSHDFSDLSKKEKKAGFEIKAVEAFQNGYQFKELEQDDTNGVDENNNTVATYKGISVTYEKDGKEIWLSVSKGIPEDGEETPTDTRQVEGITVRFNQDTYKDVPEDYELTEEDKENEAKEHYYISYGSDSVEMKEVSNVNWDDGELHYNLMQFDTTLSEDELMNMAAEIINSK